MSAAKAVVQDMFKEAAARRTYWRQRDATREDEEWNEWRRHHDDIAQVRWFPPSPRTAPSLSEPLGAVLRVPLNVFSSPGSRRRSGVSHGAAAWLSVSLLHARCELSPTDPRRAAQEAKFKQELLKAKRASQIQQLEAQRSSLQVREELLLHCGGKQHSQHSVQSRQRGAGSLWL